MSLLDHLLLLGAGLLAGVINSVSSGGSFFTYPALLATGLAPINAATTVLAALLPGNLAAVPEYWPEVRAQRHRYPALVATVLVGSSIGVVLLLSTGADAFEVIVPWLVLLSVGLFAVSPAIHRWAQTNAQTLTDGRLGWALLFVLAIYLTYFGSGVGNLFLAMLTIRGFGDFLSANAAKNIVMTVGSLMAVVVYSVVGWVEWEPLIPLLMGSSVGGWFGARSARSIPVRWIRAFIIALGLFVAGWLFLR